MAETLVLDPVEVAVGRTEFDLTPFVGAAGPDYGDAEIEAYLADAARGSLPVDFRVPNRIVTVPLVALERGGLTFDEVRRIIQAKAALFQREGGWVKRETAAGTVYADVLKASLKLGGSSLQAWGLVDADAALTLECLPDWYGDEEDLGAIPSASGELVFTLSGARGDYPARTRLVLTDASGQAQRGLLWGLRSRHYDAAPTAALAYQAEALTPLDTAASASVAGQTVIRHASLSTGWTPVLSTQIVGTGHMTHTGSYRVWARVHTTASVPPRLRLLWDVGDLALPATNPADVVPRSGALCLVNLGTVRLDAPPVGTHRWQGVIQAAADSAGGDVSIDRLWLFPVDEGYGELRAPLPTTPGLTGYSVRDEFDGADGGLTGATLPVGGAWTFLTGDTDDYNIVSKHVERSAGVDSSSRIVTAGTGALAALDLQVDVSSTQWLTGANQFGVVLRTVNATNYVRVIFGSSDNVYLAAEKVVAGTPTSLQPSVAVSVNDSAWYTLRVRVDAAGRWSLWLAPKGSPLGSPVMSGQDTDLATGGTLASGKIGLYDNCLTDPDPTRMWDNFWAAAPTDDAVVFQNLSAELRSDGVFRQSADGNAYGPVSHVIGDLPRLPAAGMEGRVCQVILKPSRGVPGDDIDPALDAVSAHVYARPSWLFVPEA